MNENIDLTKILKNCTKGTKLYSPIFGDIYFKEIRSDYKYSIFVANGVYNVTFTKEGFYRDDADVECLLFPSKEQRDWSKFTAPWYKKEKFDPKTLNPFDKVLVRDDETCEWNVDFYSHYTGGTIFPFRCVGHIFKCCIPYNDDTKHLVGTTDEAPDYYKYWEE